MKRLVSALLGCSFAVSSLVVPASAGSSMPTIWSASRAGNAELEAVRHHWHHRRYHRHRHHGAGAAAAAGIIGLGIGAAIASGAAERQYREDREWDAYCFSKYKSYDPRTGTYLGYDGYRHPCR